MAQLEAEVWGQGTSVVLVHGSLDLGHEAWLGLRPLADEGYRVVVVNRSGYGGSPNGHGEDYLKDASDLVDLLDEPAHLVGHSYGALATLFAAAERPESVLSLTVIEPPAFAIRSADPEVAALLARMNDLSAQTGLSDREFLEAFFAVVGVPTDEVPSEMMDAFVKRVPLLRHGRRAWEAEPPLARLSSHGLSVLVVSGGHHEAFEAVCDELVQQLDARKVTITGAGHEVPMMADELSRELLAFWRSL